MDSEKNPTPPAGSAPDGEGAAGASPDSVTPARQQNVDELLDAARGEVKPRPASAANARTPVTPSAKEASANTRAESAPAGDVPGKETPAGTPAAARAVPETGASKTTSTPTPAINKGVSEGVAAKVPATTARPATPARPAAAAAAKTPAAGTTVTAPEGDDAIFKMRRRIIWASVAGFLAASFLMFLRFFLPRSITEPSNVIRLGFPGDYNFGVDTKWQQQYRIWVVKNSERLFVINAICTHLGCTPDWKESENKFKCPCHGSGYDSEGINFEGPAPRPMDRAYVELDAEGQIVADKGRLFMWPKGEKNGFNDEGSFIRIA